MLAVNPSLMFQPLSKYFGYKPKKDSKYLIMLIKKKNISWSNVSQGLLENSELCGMNNLIEQSQNKNSCFIISTSILDKED